MLKIAYPYRDKINKKFIEEFESGHLDDMFHCSYMRYEFDIEIEDWNTIQRVSIDNHENVIGYFSASIDRASFKVKEIVEFSLHNLTENEMLIFLEDRISFFDFLLNKKNFRKIEFTCLSESKTEKLNSHLADKTFDGFQIVKIGIAKESVRTLNGLFRDRVFYEIVKT